MYSSQYTVYVVSIYDCVLLVNYFGDQLCQKLSPGQYLVTKSLKIPLRYCQILNRKYLAL